jgi:hypothetical protein
MKRDWYAMEYWMDEEEGVDAVEVGEVEVL